MKTKKIKMTDDPTITLKAIGLSKKNSDILNSRIENKTVKVKDCVLWTGSTNGKGHGRIRINGILTYAHRLVYMINFGKIPEGFNVHHICENPSCVNPEHLTLIHHGKHVQLHENKITLEEARI